VASTLEEIAATGAQVRRTDRHGTVTVTFDAGVPMISGVR
jgi:beta-lactamase superfamily II metal-dependent hydrolase